ncbi:MAG TPA: helix-turn-helix domain-containing protein [Chitinophagales bacterium]|nr:helix-turn-helix domain-containing protein [Chitinophagales bacterium]
MKTKTTNESRDKLFNGRTDTYFNWLLLQEKELDNYWTEIFIKRERRFHSILELKIGSEEKKEFILAEIKEAQNNLSDETLTTLYLDLNLPYNDLIETVNTYRKTATEFATAIKDDEIPGAEHIHETAKILSQEKVNLNNNVFSNLMTVTKDSGVTSAFFVPVFGKNHPTKAVCAALFFYHHEKEHLKFLAKNLDKLNRPENIEAENEQIKNQFTTGRQELDVDAWKVDESQDAILNIEQASLFLNLAKQTIYGLTSGNKIPFMKRGKKLSFRKSRLMAWIMEGEKKSISEMERDLKGR